MPEPQRRTVDFYVGTARCSKSHWGPFHKDSVYSFSPTARGTSPPDPSSVVHVVNVAIPGRYPR